MSQQTQSASRRPVLLPLMAICLVGLPAFADPRDPDSDLYSKSLAEILDMEISSVSRSDESVRRAPAEVTVYTREDLDRLKPRNLTELLELTPGMLVGRDTDDINWGSRGVVTDNNQKFLVTIDGRRINNNNNFGINPFHKARHLIEIAERIEVVRGAGGVLWGSDAFLGLINVVTRRPARGTGTTSDVTVAAGNNDLKALSASYLERLEGGTGVSFFLSSWNSDGQEIDTSLAGRGGADVSTGSYYERFESPTVTFNGRVGTDDRWLAANLENIVASVEGAPQEEEFSHSSVEGGARFDAGRLGKLVTRVFGNRIEAERRSSDGSKPGLFSVTPETRIGADAILTSRIGEDFTLVTGVESRYLRYTGGAVGNLDRSDGDYGVVRPIPSYPSNASAAGSYAWNGVFSEGVYTAGRWEFRLGGRYDFFSDRMKDLFAPRASVAYYPDKSLSIKALYAEGALRPSWTQLSGFFSFNGTPNVELEPETSRTYELLLDYARGDYLGSLSIYHTNYDDTINFVSSPLGVGFVNYADYETSGAELLNRLRVDRSTHAFLAVSWYADVSRDENLRTVPGGSLFGQEGSQVRPGTRHPYNIPDVTLSGGMSFGFPAWGREVTVTPIVRYLGERTVLPRDNLPERSVEPLYLDLKGSVEIVQGLTFHLIGRNVLDEDEPEGIARGIPGLVTPIGATWEGRVTYRF